MNKHTTELLKKHFDTAFAAPDGIKKLRELILTLAMQGKLVPQDPNAQPASELLKKIETEKQRLVKEGKIKKPKPLLPVTDEEKPYVLPQGWEWVRLGTVVLTTTGGGTPSKNNPAFWGGDIPWASVKDLNVEIYLESTIDSITDAAVAASSTNVIPKGQIIVCTRMGLGKIAINRIDTAINQDLKALSISANIDQMYFFNKYKGYKIVGSGMTVQGIRQEDLLNYLFPLPPFEEQKRIVAKIDELMACCDELEKLRTAQKGARLTVHAAAIKQLLNIAKPDQHQRAQAFLAEHFGELYTVKENVAELRKAILQLAVMGKLVPQNPNDQPASELLRKINTVKRTLEEKEGLRTSAAPFVSQSEEIYGKPEGWSYCRLGNIGKFIDYRGKTPTKVEIGVPLITAKNVRFGYINREPKEYLTPEEYIRWMTRGFPRVGDILFTTEAPLGNVAIIDIEEKFALAQRVICLQLHMPEIATWLKNFMMSDSFQEGLLLEATGMTATGIKASKLKEMPVPIPPLEEQYRIVAKVDQVMALCDSLDQHIDAAITKQAELLSAVVAQV